MENLITKYNDSLKQALDNFPNEQVKKLAEELNIAWKNKNSIFYVETVEVLVMEFI